MTGPGKISWFNDSTTASGISAAANPGLAVDNQATLGGYWLVKMPNGKQAVLKQIDIGPAPWTGRTYDFSEPALGPLGYSSSNFPTDAIAEATYLGKSVPAQFASLVLGQGGSASSGGSSPSSPSTSSPATSPSSAPAAATTAAPSSCMIPTLQLLAGGVLVCWWRR